MAQEAADWVVVTPPSVDAHLGVVLVVPEVTRHAPAAAEAFGGGDKQSDSSNATQKHDGPKNVAKKIARDRSAAGVDRDADDDEAIPAPPAGPPPPEATAPLSAAVLSMHAGSPSAVQGPTGPLLGASPLGAFTTLRDHPPPPSVPPRATSADDRAMNDAAANAPVHNPWIQQTMGGVLASDLLGSPDAGAVVPPPLSSLLAASNANTDASATASAGALGRTTATGSASLLSPLLAHTQRVKHDTTMNNVTASALTTGHGGGRAGRLAPHADDGGWEMDLYADGYETRARQVNPLDLFMQGPASPAATSATAANHRAARGGGKSGEAEPGDRSKALLPPVAGTSLFHQQRPGTTFDFPMSPTPPAAFDAVPHANKRSRDLFASPAALPRRDDWSPDFALPKRDLSHAGGRGGGGGGAGVASHDAKNITSRPTKPILGDEDL
jgi:hypothetical protein